MSYEPIHLDKEMALRLTQVLSGLTVILRTQHLIGSGIEALGQVGATPETMREISKGAGDQALVELVKAIRVTYPDGMTSFYKEVATLCNKLLELDPILAMEFTGNTGVSLQDLERSLEED